MQADIRRRSGAAEGKVIQLMFMQVPLKLYGRHDHRYTCVREWMSRANSSVSHAKAGWQALGDCCSTLPILLIE